MNDVTPPSGDWAGPAAFLTATGAMIASFFRKGLSAHKVRNEINAAVLPVITDVAVLKTEYREITRRLDGLDRGQVRLENKLDRILEQR